MWAAAGKGADQAGAEAPPVALRGLRPLRALHRHSHGQCQSAGVADRLRFEHRDVTEGLPEQYDMITTFDVVHDAVDGRRLLRVIGGAGPGGRYMLEGTARQAGGNGGWLAPSSMGSACSTA